MSDKIKAFFDARAAGWDAMIPAEIVQRAREIINGLDIAPGSRVLDVGCGTGVLFPMLLDKTRGEGFIAATDISFNMMQEACNKDTGAVGCFQSDVTCLPLRDGVFDWVVCYSVFPHFVDQRQTVRTLAQSLKPGGRFVVCHSKSREDINAFHRTVGDVVGGHELPDEPQMRNILQSAHLTIDRIENQPDRYIALATKP